MHLTRWSRWSLWGLIGWLVLLGMGCAHVISEPLRAQAQAEPSVSFAELRANPESYKDRTVILGGEILNTNNLREATRLEVLQRPLSGSEKPTITDNTGGRFMALCDEYLDPAVYAPGRRITMAGRVLGSYLGKVGEVDYRYPLIACQEIHLFPSATAELQRYTMYPWWYGPPYGAPWYWWGPPDAYWRPYYRSW
jgi:outer membrane lipoprotein